MADAEVVLGSQIAALIVALHNEGVLNCQSVLNQLQAGLEFQPEHRAILETAVRRVEMLRDALGPFEPRTLSATPPTHSG